MDDQRKRAYRDLLYWAMLDLRSHEVASPYVRPPWWSVPFWLRVLRRLRYTMVVADWLHNLAYYSSVDFESFDEARFWREFESTARRFPAFGWASYEDRFERGPRPSPAPDDVPPRAPR